MSEYRIHNRRSVSHKIVAVLVGGALFASYGGRASAAIGSRLRTVALSSMPAVGTGSQFVSFEAPVLNDAGQTAYDANVSQIGLPYSLLQKGIWSEGSGSLTLLARVGNPAPGTPYTFGNASLPTINNAGQTAFKATLTGGVSFSNHGIFRSSSGGVELLVRLGSPAPKPASLIPEMQFTYLAHPVMNDSGQLGLVGGFDNTPSGGYSGLWSGDATNLQLVAHQYMQGGGLEQGDYIGYFPSYDDGIEVAINNHGHLAFVAHLHGPSIPFTFYERSIWRYDGQAAMLVVRQGDAVPGSEFVFRDISTPALNNSGQLVFSAGVVDPADRGAYRYSGIWIAEGNDLLSVVRGGEPAPGLPDVRFASTLYPTLNGRGSVAFVASLEGLGVTEQNNTSVWKMTPAGLELVAREGEFVPGTNIRFTDLFYTELAYNQAGQLAFAQTTGYVGNFSGQLWAQDVDGSFQRIAGAGMQLEVAPGDFRTVKSVSFVGGSGLQDGRRVGFNEFGQAAFQAEFTDGSSGVFVSNLVAVPEPASLALAAILAMAAVGNRRKLVPARRAVRTVTLDLPRFGDSW